jgi:formate-nitrite transporter family protein
MTDEEQDQPEGPLKPLRTILATEVRQAEEELDRPAQGILVSGVLAGIAVGTSTLATAAILTLATGELPYSVVSILAANAYTVGFILVILAHTDLFTEYTTIAILPVLMRRADVASLARLWALVYSGNMAGAAVVALLLAHLGPALEILDAATVEGMARRLVHHAWWVILLSAVLAGWLMGLLSWLIAAGRDTISQIVFVWIITGAIALGHLHHAITGSLDVMAAMFMGGDIPLTAFFRMLLLTTAGNALGGVVFAVLIRYSLIMREEDAEGMGESKSEKNRPARREGRPGLAAGGRRSRRER